MCRNLRPALTLACALALSGCTLHGAVHITGSGSLASTPGGPAAVLEVVVPYNTQVSARGPDWGIVRTQNPDARFADLIAHAARDDAGLDVIPPHKVSDALAKAELQAGLQPDPAAIRQAIQTVGCASYLSADVTRWHYDYVLFTSSALIEFTLTCRSAVDGQALWTVHVFRRSRGLSDGEVARLALAEAFRWLQDNEGALHPPPAEAGAP